MGHVEVERQGSSAKDVSDGSRLLYFLRGAQRPITNTSQFPDPLQSPRRETSLRNEPELVLVARATDVLEPSVKCTTCSALLDRALAGIVVCFAFCFVLRLSMTKRYTLPRFPDASAGLSPHDVARA